MNPAEILKRILPELNQSFYYGQTTGERPRKFRASNAEDLCRIGLEYSGRGIDAYFAMASFDGPKRSGKHAVAARSLWLDVDCGRPDDPYRTLQEGQTAVRDFVEEVGLPEPLTVCSGLGLHVYFTFDRNLSKEAWLWLAAQFKQAVDLAGLAADHHRTTDIVSVLRIPGTFNYKDGAVRPVYLLTEGEIADPVGFGAALVRYAGEAAETTGSLSASADSAISLALLTGPADWDPMPVIEGCAQVRLAGHPQAKRQSWLYMLGVMKFCRQGREAAHAISGCAPARYDPAELDRQFDSLEATGPIRCSTFQSADPRPCRACSWAGTVSTPVDIARRTGTAALPVRTPGLTPFENYDFRVVPGQGLYRIEHPENQRRSRARADPEGPPPAPEFILINENEFYITEVQADTEQIQEKRYIEFTVKYRSQTAKTVYLSIEDDLSVFSLPKWLGNHGLLPVKRTYNEWMIDFMGSYIASLQSQVTREQKSHFGWTEYRSPADGRRGRGFVTGRTMHTDHGPVDIALSGKCQTMAEKEFIRAGSLEIWKSIPDMYKVLDQKEAQLFMCGSFAAPFMSFGAAAAKNLILSIWDARGGRGKSTLLQAVNSVWGHPTQMSCSKNDSMSARFQILSARHNLPFCMDELSSMTESELSVLMYDIANGRERRKSHRTGAELIDTGFWETVTFISSNRSVYELMRSRSAQTTAESMRVIEVPCLFENYAGTPAGNYIERCLGLLNGNYGWAGPAFIENCFADRSAFETAAAQARDWDQKNRRSADERFWTYGLGTILAAGRLAVRYGYLNYDIGDLEKWILSSLLPKIREKIADTVQTPEGIFGEFLNSSINSTLVVMSARRPGSVSSNPLNPAMDMYVKRLPSKELMLRLEADTQTLYVSLNFLHKWCSQHHVSWDELKLSLLKNKVWTGRKMQVSLGQDVPVMGSVRVRCMKFDLKDFGDEVLVSLLRN
jgi:hypothetical protein